MSHLRQTWKRYITEPFPPSMEPQNQDVKTLVKIIATMVTIIGVIAAATITYLVLTMFSNNLFTDHALQTPLTYTVTPAPTAPKRADAAQPVNPPGTLPPYDVDSDPTMFHHMWP